MADENENHELDLKQASPDNNQVAAIENTDVKPANGSPFAAILNQNAETPATVNATETPLQSGTVLQTAPNSNADSDVSVGAVGQGSVQKNIAEHTDADGLTLAIEDKARPDGRVSFLVKAQNQTVSEFHLIEEDLKAFVAKLTSFFAGR